MTSIHPTAVIDPTAKIGENVEIGPYTLIGPHCEVGDGCRLDGHVVLKEYTTLGRECTVASGAVLGGLPQDLGFKGEESYVVIGERTVIREHVTVNRASGEGKTTRVGNGCMLMAGAHLGHNAQMGNEVIMANGSMLGGYAEVGDQAFLSGLVAVHQFVRIGRMAIVGGSSATRQDIPPFAMTDGRPAVIVGINKVGLKRRGFTLEQRTRLKKAFTALWFSSMNTRQAVEAMRAEFGGDAAVEELLQFVETSKRGIKRPHLGASQSTRVQDPSGLNDNATDAFASDLLNV